MGISIATIGLVLNLAFGWVPGFASLASQATSPPYVISELSSGGRDLETGKPARFTLTLREPVSVGTDGVLSPDPVEFRRADGQSSPIRPFFHRVHDDFFEAWVTFDQQGDWQVVLYPDVAGDDRSLLPTIVPVESVVRVTIPPPGWLGPLIMVGTAVGLLAIAMGGRRPAGPKKKPPPVHTGDSWWWSP